MEIEKFIIDNVIELIIIIMNLIVVFFVIAFKHEFKKNEINLIHELKKIEYLSNIIIDLRAQANIDLWNKVLKINAFFNSTKDLQEINKIRLELIEFLDKNRILYTDSLLEKVNNYLRLIENKTKDDLDKESILSLNQNFKQIESQLKKFFLD